MIGKDRFLYAGLFVSLVSITLDNIGVQLTFWNYLRPVTPAFPSYIPYDSALMPVCVLFVIRYFYNRNPWIVGLLFGMLTEFIGEPLFKCFGIYHRTNWKFSYSISFLYFDLPICSQTSL
ncbi:CBO0543 family protein [Bacillus sp. AFS076308]|uniref:CBO0543 family protein n=1 Tax=unclassified Bacillus (in: firmicutes) TaxID=185979 RepID=UPI0034D358E8